MLIFFFTITDLSFTYLQAAKINEAVYGKNDHRSRQSYEKFSYIYSEAGKLQYNGMLIYI